MDKKELIEKLESLPDGIPIWLGADSDEGWLPLKEVFAANAIFCGLDGDERTNYEFEQVEDGYVPKDGEIVDDEKSGWWRVYRDVIVLGDRNSRKEVTEAVEWRLNKKENRKKELERTKSDIQKRLEKIEEELKEL